MDLLSQHGWLRFDDGCVPFNAVGRRGKKSRVVRVSNC